MVLVLERAGVAAAAAAAVQRMRGLPEPVGLGTERQHMFMASFLPPLPSFSRSHLPLSLPLSFSSSLLITLIFSSPTFYFHFFWFWGVFALPVGDCIVQGSKTHWGSLCPPRTAHRVSPLSRPLVNSNTRAHPSLSFCHLAYDQRICGAAGSMLWLWGGSLLHFWCHSKSWSPAPWPVSALHKHWPLSKHVRTNTIN